MTQLVGSGTELGSDLLAVVGDESAGSSPISDVAVDEDVGSSSGGEFSSSIGEHAVAAAEPVGEVRNVGVAAAVMRRGPKK